MSCICVLGVSSQDSEMSCICVLGVSVPSQDSEMSCICVLGVSSQDSEKSCICASHSPDMVQILLTHKYMTSHCPDLVQIRHSTQIHDIVMYLCAIGIKSGY
jgi:hypothetical protein